MDATCTRRTDAHECIYVCVYVHIYIYIYISEVLTSLILMMRTEWVSETLDFSPSLI